MRTLKFLNQAKLFMISLCIFGILTSCKKDKADPDFVGTWVATGTIEMDTIMMDYKDIMTFSTGSFSDIGQIKNPGTNEWVNLIGAKGSISLNGSAMNITVTEIGISAFDMISGMPTGMIIYYNDSQSEFTSLLSQSGMNKTTQSEYSVSGNNLTLKTDNNNDGDYNDANEVTVYTKQ